MKKLLLSNKYIIFALIIYVIIAIVQTYPLIFNLTTSFPGVEMDAYNYVWNIDTFWSELKQFHNPFYTNRIFFPLQTSLVFHTYAPLLALPAILFSDYTLYMNLTILFSISAIGLTTYLLVKELSSNFLTSFMAGVLFSSSTIVWSFVYSSHYYYIHALPLLLLALLFFYRFLRLFRIHEFVKLCLTIILLFFLDYYTTVFLFIMLLSAFLYALCFREIRERLFAFIRVPSHLVKLFGAVTGIILVPIFIFFFVISDPSDTFGRISSVSSYPAFCNTNTLEFLLPNTHSLIGGMYMEQFRQKYALDANFDTPEYSVGLVLLFLAIPGVWLIRHDVRKQSLMVAGVAMGLLSLGSVIRFGKVDLLAGPYTPFYYFSQLPFLGLIDCPVRMVLGFHLLISLLVGVVIGAVITRVSGLTKIVILIIFVLYIVLFRISAGMPLASASTPLVYHKLAGLPEKSLLELPSGIIESKDNFGNDWSIPAIHTKQLFWQITHRKPRIGGYLSRLPKEYYTIYESEPILSDLFAFTALNGEWSGRNFTSEQIQHFKTKYNLGYVVFSPNPRQHEFRGVFEDQFRDYIETVEESEDFALYRLR